MTKVTALELTQVDCYRTVTCASDIGLKPGEWPLRIQTDLGNGQDFVMVQSYIPESVVYLQEAGNLTLTIYND